MKRIITPIVLCALVSTSVQASLNGCQIPNQDERNTKFYYANGVGNSLEDALESLGDLEAAYGSNFAGADEIITYHVAYNNTQGLRTDLDQVFLQKMIEIGIEGDPFLMATLIREGVAPEDFQAFFNRELTEEEQQDFEDLLESTTVNAIRELVLDTNVQTNIYESDLLSGTRVIIVAHSQGNLYSNAILSEVVSRQPDRAASIGYYGVASPANAVINHTVYADNQNNAYVTADDDRIINGLRDYYPVLQANIDNDPGVLSDDRDAFNHEFFRGYFDPELASRGRIDTSVAQLFENIQYPTVTAGAGAIRASLTWGIQRDVDLHVFEPDGNQVYYADPFGDDGSLDVDDRNSFGPENYFVACDAVNQGTYQVGVNYFSGNGPETASISLFLGDGVVHGPRNRVLDTPRGRTGDSSPFIMFTITVTDDGQGNAIYAVE